jgi:hypothetical protein
MKSWDCFDTLVSRRFTDPHTVHDEVGKRLGIPNFKDLRIAAERKSDNTYAGIYRNLPGIDPNVEIQVELEHCYPIIENINQVQDGDLIVSDIYHTAETVEKILRSCGLTKTIKFHVTPDGKRRGWIWPTLKGIDLHIGDNKKSDVKSPANYGIKAFHYTNCFFNDVEKTVAEKNYQLASWMRYVRLQCPYTDSNKKSLWEDQTNYNLPILVLASLELPNTPIAFTYRDSVFWKPLYEKLTNKSAIRFDSSRAMLTNPTPEFKIYAENAVRGCAIVDLQGTGKSLFQFFNSDQIIYFIGGKTIDHPNIRSITGMRAPAIEKHNCSNQGSVISWNNEGAVRAPLEHDTTVVDVQHACFDIAVNSISKFQVNKDLGLLKNLLERMKKDYTDISVTWTENHI